MKANRKSLINHALCRLHLDSLSGKRRPPVKPSPKAKLKVEPAIIPDTDPLYEDGQIGEDGEIFEDGSMPGTSFGPQENDDDMSYMVTEVDPAQLDSGDEDYDYEENGTGSFRVPSHIANGSSVSINNLFLF